MARFDVYKSKDREPAYLLDCQSDLLRDFETRLVVPLYRAEGAAAATRLHPIFEVEGNRVVMVTQLASAVLAHAMGPKAANLVNEDVAIINALNTLISGV